MKLEELRKRLRSYVEPKRSEKQPSKHKKARKATNKPKPATRIDGICKQCKKESTVDVFRSEYQNERVTGLRDGGAFLCPHCGEVNLVELAP